MNPSQPERSRLQLLGFLAVVAATLATGHCVGAPGQTDDAAPARSRPEARLLARATRLGDASLWTGGPVYSWITGTKLLTWQGDPRLIRWTQRYRFSAFSSDVRTGTATRMGRLNSVPLPTPTVLSHGAHNIAGWQAASRVRYASRRRNIPMARRIARRQGSGIGTSRRLLDGGREVDAGQPSVDRAYGSSAPRLHNPRSRLAQEQAGGAGSRIRNESPEERRSHAPVLWRGRSRSAPAGSDTRAARAASDLPGTGR